MLQIVERVAAAGESGLTLTLAFEERERSRLRVRLSSGEEAALVLPRGSVLRGGEALRTSDGRIVRVVAAPESVSTVRSPDGHALLRAAYHLGNRHVPLELGRGYLRYLHDHVLDALVRELGLEVTMERAAFEPEAGAYAGHSHHATVPHHHHDDHGHVHGEQHQHDDHAHAHGEHHHPHERPHDHGPHLPHGRAVRRPG